MSCTHKEKWRVCSECDERVWDAFRQRGDAIQGLQRELEKERIIANSLVAEIAAMRTRHHREVEALRAKLDEKKERMFSDEATEIIERIGKAQLVAYREFMEQLAEKAVV